MGSAILAENYRNYTCVYFLNRYPSSEFTTTIMTTSNNPNFCSSSFITNNYLLTFRLYILTVTHCTFSVLYSKFDVQQCLESYALYLNQLYL